MNGWCTPTPATEGDRVVAFFGPAGMHCFDTDGKEVWELQLGDFPGKLGCSRISDNYQWHSLSEL